MEPELPGEQEPRDMFGTLAEACLYAAELNYDITHAAEEGLTQDQVLHFQNELNRVEKFIDNPHQGE